MDLSGCIMRTTKKISLHNLEKGGCDMTGILKYDVVKIDLSGSIGSEQGKIRYGVVIQNDDGNIHSSTTIIIPFTHVLKGLHIPTHALIKKTKCNGLKVDSLLLGEQMRVISEKRIIEKVGRIEDEYSIEEIKRVYKANFGE